MMIDRLRWMLLPAAAMAFLVILLRGAAPGRVAFFLICALAWYGLSRRKTRVLDRDRFDGGKLGRRS